MSDAPPRPRRRRALASALRLALAPDATPAGGMVEERLRAIAASQGVLLPPEADLPEMLVRLEPGGSLPPELMPVLATLLLPLLRLENPALPPTRLDPPLRSAPR